MKRILSIAITPLISAGVLALTFLLTTALLSAGFFGFTQEPYESDFRGGKESSRTGVAVSNRSIGTFFVTDSVQHRLQIRNKTDQPISINEFVSSCGCSRVTPSQVTLEPQEDFFLRVDIDGTFWKPTKLERLRSSFNDDVHYGRGEKPFAVTITPVFDAAKKADSLPAIAAHPTAKWTVTGVVKWPFEIVPRINLSHAIPLTNADVWRDSREIDCLFPLSSLSVTNPSRGLHVTLPRSMTVCKNGAHKLQLDIAVFPDQLVEGPFTKTVLLSGETKTGEQLSNVPVVIFGRVLPPVIAFPAQMNAGAIGMGDEHTQRILVYSPSGATIRVHGIEARGLGVQAAIKPSSMDEGKTVELIVQYRPPELGNCRAGVFVKGEFGDAQTFALTIPVRAYAMGTSHLSKE